MNCLVHTDIHSFKVHFHEWNMVQTSCRFKQITALFAWFIPPAVNYIIWDPSPTLLLIYSVNYHRSTHLYLYFPIHKMIAFIFQVLLK